MTSRSVSSFAAVFGIVTTFGRLGAPTELRLDREPQFLAAMLPRVMIRAAPAVEQLARHGQVKIDILEILREHVVLIFPGRRHERDVGFQEHVFDGPREPVGFELLEDVIVRCVQGVEDRIRRDQDREVRGVNVVIGCRERVAPAVVDGNKPALPKDLDLLLGQLELVFDVFEVAGVLRVEIETVAKHRRRRRCLKPFVSHVPVPGREFGDQRPGRDLRVGVPGLNPAGDTGRQQGGGEDGADLFHRFDAFGGFVVFGPFRITRYPLLQAGALNRNASSRIKMASMVGKFALATLERCRINPKYARHWTRRPRGRSLS